MAYADLDDASRSHDCWYRGRRISLARYWEFVRIGSGKSTLFLLDILGSNALSNAGFVVSYLGIFDDVRNRIDLTGLKRVRQFIPSFISVSSLPPLFPYPPSLPKLITYNYFIGPTPSILPNSPMDNRLQSPAPNPRRHSPSRHRDLHRRQSMEHHALAPRRGARGCRTMERRA